MSPTSWVEEFPGAVTVCDTTGVIIAMNRKSVENFAKDGGAKLIGSNLLDCHPKPAQIIIRRLLAEQEHNIYTIEKRGKRKLVYQTPWYVDGEFNGLVELILDLPAGMPHYTRD